MKKNTSAVLSVVIAALACTACNVGHTMPNGNNAPSTARQTAPTAPTPTVENKMPAFSHYELTVDDTGLVKRTKSENERSLTWVISVNGKIQLERSAEREYTYRPMDYGSGIYKVWLKGHDGKEYKKVSNEVEWEVSDTAADGTEKMPADHRREIINSKKEKMKHICERVNAHDVDVHYKKCFVIDPDHDGEPNGCIYFAGTDENGNEVQYISENMNSNISFASNDIPEKNTLYIWCDEVSGKDYIVRITEQDDGTVVAKDCCTDEVIYTKKGSEVTVFGEKTDVSRISGKGWYIFSSTANEDRDNFLVSTNGKVVLENA